MKQITLILLVLVLVLNLSSCSIENGESRSGVRRLISGTNNQGLAYNKNRLFSANDIDGINNRIIVYDYRTMKIVKDNLTLAVGHGASVEYSEKELLLYISNGKHDVLCHIYTIDIENKNAIIQRNISLESLGYSACIALDDENNVLYVITSLIGDWGDHIVTPVSIVTGLPDLSNQFTIANISVPQGATFYNGKIHFLSGITSTYIAQIDPVAKVIDNILLISSTAEPEGIAILDDVENVKYIVGYANDEVYEISIVF